MYSLHALFCWETCEFRKFGYDSFQCFTFPGLQEKTERKLKAAEAKNRKLTPWQEYKEKKARKKQEKKEAKMVC